MPNILYNSTASHPMLCNNTSRPQAHAAAWSALAEACAGLVELLQHLILHHGVLAACGAVRRRLSVQGQRRGRGCKGAASCGVHALQAQRARTCRASTHAQQVPAPARATPGCVARASCPLKTRGAPAQRLQGRQAGATGGVGTSACHGGKSGHIAPAETVLRALPLPAYGTAAQS